MILPTAKTAITIAAATALALVLGAAAPQDAPRPPAVDAVYACRDIAEPEARLACYDAAVGELAQADARRDILFADREQVKRTKRGLFGLDLSDLNIFGNGGDDDKSEQVKDITAKIARVAAVDRKYVFTLEDGARWQQADSRNLPRDPEPGMEIKIRRAALGSYVANIDGMIAVRVKRVN